LHAFATIRDLYTPIQPTIRQSAEHVIYHEFLPHPKLQPFIYCYWQLKTTAPLATQFNYRVVADGCIDIFFEPGNPKENYIMGFCKKYTEFALENDFNYIGIRFLPTMFPQLFKVNAAELSNRFEHLSTILPQTSAFITDHLHSDLQHAAIAGIFDTYFLQVLAKADIDDDPRLYNAIALILSNCGVVNIEKDLNTGISVRQLRRLFEFYIGDTAKTFSKVVRFQHILKAKPSAQSLRQNKLFFDSGYYDQAHFIKEFRNLYGVTPSKAFGR
jgi:AraC-like DNA-binding protein